MTIPPIGSQTGPVGPQEGSAKVKIEKSLEESPCEVG